jgi:F-type H+-transporting ATPase subunit delta
MLDKSLAVRYAAALYGAAKGQGSVETVLEEIDGFISVMSQDTRLRSFFLHPAISPSQKKGLLDELVENRLSKLSLSFLSILVDEKRMNYIEMIRDTLLTQFNHEQNRVKASVASVLPISPDLQKKIRERIAAYLNKDVEIEFTSDSNLLGGVKLFIEDKVIDGSVLHNLKKLENKIALG